MSLTASFPTHFTPLHRLPVRQTLPFSEADVDTFHHVFKKHDDVRPPRIPNGLVDDPLYPLSSDTPPQLLSALQPLRIQDLLLLDA